VAAPELDLVRGTFDLLILKALTWGPRHGLGVLRWLETTTSDRLQIEEGALYPALHRLEQRGWLDAEWGLTERGRKAKFYRLTGPGRKALAAEVTKWNRYADMVQVVLTTERAR
jgi:PadR family transcriptional regulator PadR